MGKLDAYLRLVRIEHGVMTGLAAVAGYLSVGWYTSGKLLLVFASSLLAETALFALNDIFNVEEDRVNSPERPLVKGEVSVREAAALALASSSAALALAATLGLPPLALVVAALFLGNAYNAYLKRHSFFGNIIVSALTASSFLYGALAAGAIPDKVALFFIIAFLANIGREILKGIRDLEGDMRVGVCTLACEIGVERAAFVSAVFMALAVVLSFAAVEYFEWKYYFLPLILATDVIFVHAIYNILKNPNPASAGKFRKTTLAGMLLAIIAFILR